MDHRFHSALGQTTSRAETESVFLEDRAERVCVSVDRQECGTSLGEEEGRVQGYTMRGRARRPGSTGEESGSRAAWGNTGYNIRLMRRFYQKEDGLFRAVALYGHAGDPVREPERTFGP